MSKKEFKLISFIIIGSVGFTLLGDPLKYLLHIYWNHGPENNALLAGIIIRLILISVLLFIIQKLGFSIFNGFKRKVSIRNKSVLILPFFLVLAGILLNWEIYIEAGDFHITLITVSVLCYGIVEELCFRGLVLPLSINAFENRTNSLYLGLILSSVLFGFVHYARYLDTPDFWSVTSQVIYATAMGVLLGAFMLRTGNIFVPAFIHSALNFLFAHGLISNAKTNQSFELLPTEQSFQWLDLLGSVFLFLLVLGIGLNMIKLVNRKTVLNDLNHLKI